MGYSRLQRKLIYLRRTLTFKKAVNVVLGETELFLKRNRLRSFPSKLTIDIGNICNLKCPLCPTGRGDKGAAKGFMGMDSYCRIVDELGPYLTKLELYNWGEPLLNKNLIDMINYAKARGIQIAISTNLNILDRETARALIATDIDKILISCDGASPETYAKYRKGGDFQKVIDNIRLLTEAKRDLKNDYTRLKLLFHVFRHNEHEVDRVRELAGSMGIELFIDRMRTDMGKEILETARASIERDREWIPDDPQFCPFDMEKKEKLKDTGCTDLWKRSVINWNGDVFPCCSVYGDRYSFGNIFDRSFASVWNNEKYVSARREVANLAETSPTVCHTCKTHGFRHF